MRHTVYRLIIGIGAALVLCGVVVAVLIWLGNKGDVTAGETRTAVAPSVTDATSEPTERLRAPGRYAGYEAMSQQDKLDLVSRHMHEHELDAVSLAFLKQELANGDLIATLRNNIANTLCWQRHADPYLHRLFIAFIEDQTESRTWREYSVQFLGQTLAFTAEPEVVRATLWRLVREDRDGLAGTAAIHLALQAEQGRIELPAGFAETLGEALVDPAVSRRAKMAMVGVLAKRRERQYLPVIRSWAATAREDGLRRVSLAALGQMGEATKDAAVLRAALSDPNPAVVKAAEGALRRLGLALPADDGDDRSLRRPGPLE